MRAAAANLALAAAGALVVAALALCVLAGRIRS